MSGSAEHVQRFVASPTCTLSAQLHRSRPCMRFHALHLHDVPALAQRTRDGTDSDARALQRRPLLDVRRKVGVEPRRTVCCGGCGRSGLSYGLERLQHTDAGRIALRHRMLQTEASCIDARAHHHRHEARPLFVGPHAHLQRRRRAHAALVQRSDDLEPGKHTSVAIKLAALGLSVDVTAGRHGRQTPPFGVAPMAFSSIRRCQSLSLLMAGPSPIGVAASAAVRSSLEALGCAAMSGRPLSTCGWA
jgi:hypothetical protein